MITWRAATQARGACSIEKIQVRSPMTCEAPLGVCRLLLRHGPGHRPAGRGGHGRRHHRRPVDRRAGHPAHDADVPHRRRRHPRRRGEGRQGQARRARSSSSASTSSSTTKGKKIALSRNGEIQILDPKGRELEKYDVPNGADHDGRGRPDGQPRHDALRVGPAQHPDPGRGRRQGPLRRHRRGRDDEDRDRPLGPRPPDDHRAQGRPAPADHHRGRRGQDPRLQLHPREGEHRGAATAR